MRVPLLVSVGLVVLATACADPSVALSGGAAGVGFPMRVTDDVGRAIGVAVPLERIVSLSPINTEVLFRQDLQDRVVGVDDYANYPDEAKNKHKVEGASSVPIWRKWWLWDLI